MGHEDGKVDGRARPAYETGHPAEPDLLTPEEQEDLRREMREAGAYAKKAFAHLRPKG